jgi:hypothetical protein
MPLTTETAAPALGLGNPPRWVNARICIVSELIPPAVSALIVDGPAEPRFNSIRHLFVDVAKAEAQGGANTALGRAVSWLAEVLREGGTVAVTGPHAETIVIKHLHYAGFSEDEARVMLA